jgi:hypothetical protein
LRPEVHHQVQSEVEIVSEQRDLLL